LCMAVPCIIVNVERCSPSFGKYSQTDLGRRESRYTPQ
jgi:hypothetical protein